MGDYLMQIEKDYIEAKDLINKLQSENEQQAKKLRAECLRFARWVDNSEPDGTAYETLWEEYQQWKIKNKA